MQIELKVIGDALLASLTKDLKELNEAFFRLCTQSEMIEVKLTRHLVSPEGKGLLLKSDTPTLMLVEAPDMQVIERLQAMERRELLLDGTEPRSLALAPIIAVFHSHASLAEVRDLPELVSDWVFLPVNSAELARRIILSLKRKAILKTRLRFGALTLVPETRLVFYADKSVHLTRSEFALAELFLSQAGTVIPFSDLVALFKSSGKSTEGSNIRVTVFQLRLKLEMLTRSQFTIVSVYKRGYCLKQKGRPCGLDPERLGMAMAGERMELALSA